MQEDLMGFIRNSVFAVVAALSLVTAPVASKAAVLIDGSVVNVGPKSVNLSTGYSYTFTISSLLELVSYFQLSKATGSVATLELFKGAQQIYSASFFPVGQATQTAGLDNLLGAGTYTYKVSGTGTSTLFQTTFASAVPEPATWAMMVLGFVGLGFMAYRRDRLPRRASFRLS